MKTILLQNGHEMYEEAFQEKFNYILQNLKEKSCKVVDYILAKPNCNTLADFSLIIEDFDDMQLRDSVANYYVEYSVETQNNGLTIVHFNLK